MHHPRRNVLMRWHTELLFHLCANAIVMMIYSISIGGRFKGVFCGHRKCTVAQ